ncbi:hypothetical protein CFP65_5863 [Kitasatospora sp. MMS16-BH015]|uniref:thioesterase II family protein n=1 Tax=Kitasatospora sp. MMS16-BH015 TaxID=2018025 RepID=UPI000CA2FA12|nr:thioesterase domain-containing protein [Kitasatospora sp. MMS16-BH015]AUG80544.1 hypothetical protein CFP65_5863 [Kitasatospora sp. MMS16-BH015]
MTQTPPAATTLPWLVPLNVAEGARRHLVCLGQAGTGTAPFTSWSAVLGAETGVWAARLPGRESRLLEEATADQSVLVEALHAAVEALPAGEVHLYGHCGGALLAFELAHRLGPRLASLTVQRQSTPLRPTPRHPVPLPQWTTAQLTDYLRALGGTPEAVLASAEAMAVMTPALRADLRYADEYECRPDRAPLAAPVLSIADRADTKVPPAQAAEWAATTTGPFRLLVPEQQPGTELSARIPELLRPYLAGGC